MWARYDVDLVLSSGLDRPECDGMVDGSFEVVIDRPAAHVTKSRRTVLGTTRLQMVSIDRSPIHIDFGAVQEILELLPAEQLVALTGHSEIDSRDLGRALGRVLAHEIGHVLLFASNHQPAGLMRESFRAADLVVTVRDSFTLSKAEIERLHYRKITLTAPIE